MLIFRVIDDASIEVKKDEPVISSNLGGLFPSGLLIGTIKDVIPDQYGLTKIAYVEPAANLKEIKEVIVVDRKLDTISEEEDLENIEDEEDEEEGNSDE